MSHPTALGEGHSEFVGSSPSGYETFSAPIVSTISQDIRQSKINAVPAQLAFQTSG